MIRLDLNREPHWLEVEPGVDLLLRPMGSAIWLAARRAPEVVALSAEGGAGDEASFTVALTVAVAQRAVMDWRGVGDLAGHPIPVTPEAVAALLDRRPSYEAFAGRYMAPWMLLEAEKKPFAPEPDGTGATAPNTAPDAPACAPDAPGFSTRRTPSSSGS